MRMIWRTCKIYLEYIKHKRIIIRPISICRFQNLFILHTLIYTIVSNLYNMRVGHHTKLKFLHL